MPTDPGHEFDDVVEQLATRGQTKENLKSVFTRAAAARVNGAVQENAAAQE